MQKTPAPEILLRFHHHHHLLFLLLFFFFFFFSISLCFVLPSSAVASSSNGDEEDGTAIATDQKQALLDLLKGLQAPNTTNSCITSTWGAQAGAGAHPWPCPSSFCGITCDSEGYVEALDLSEQGLRGRIEPNMVSKLTRLSKLDLSNNRLSGQLPRDIGDLTALNYLNLSSNSIAGSIPSELAKLTALQALDLHANLLRGEIDPSLLAMASLAFVDLSSNKLQGFLPWQPNDTLPVLRTLEHVNLSRNLLTGPLAPPKFSSVFAERLSVLDVSHNQLSGELPDFEFVIALSTLRLDHNSFTGSVPATLLSATLGLLAELDLSNNKLTGTVDRVSSTSLKYLNLSFNALSGQLPVKLGSCSIVDLSHNAFSRDLSALSYWTDMLEILDLSSNRLTGNLQGDIYMFVRLRNLNLSNNWLSGPIPTNYGFLPKLSSIDLSYNQLSGDMPRSLLNSSTLSYLLLSNNELTGNLLLDGASATTSASSPRMASIDLSKNRLNGNISEGISRFQMLKDLNLGHNRFSGHIPSSISSLVHLQSLDLSSNELSGPIPQSLPNALVQLRLSNNNLSGQIPANLERFPNSSFYPGNKELHALWPLGGVTAQKAPSITTSSVHRQSFGVELKAGLIAGSLAAFALLLGAAFLFYYKHSSRSGKSSRSGIGARGIPKGHNVWSPCATYLDSSNNPHLHHHKASAAKNPSADLLLDRLSESSKGSDKAREPNNKESLKQKVSFEMSPKRSPRMGEELLSSPVILKVQSPDKLAGDLHFLDKSLLFSAEDLSRAPAEVLGRSSHGTSYKATLDNGHVLTVKWLREGLAKSKKEFGREANKFAKVKHPNLIPLRGYYWGPREHEKLILSDFVRAGSLAAHIADRAGQRYGPLSWHQRMVIAADIARGLWYLHEERHLAHGNLKATNVLIDTPSYNAKLADYGLHELMTPEGTSNQILNAGALGYRAPELASMKKPRPSLKGDIYAFGVLLLELLTGQGAGDIISGQSGAVDLTDWVRLLVTEGRALDCFDPMLVGGDKGNEKLLASMEETLNLALKCISPQPPERPSIRSAYEDLVGNSCV